MSTVISLGHADRREAVALGRDDRLEAGCGKFGADGVGVITAVREQGLDAVSQHPEQWAKGLYIVRLTRRHDETERSAVSIAASVELSGEATTEAASSWAS